MSAPLQRTVPIRPPVATVRYLEARPHVLGAAIVVISMLGLLLATTGERTAEESVPAGPRTRTVTVAPWNSQVWGAVEDLAQSGEVSGSDSTPATTEAADVAAAAVATTEPFPTEPDRAGPVVHEPPPGPNRVAPTPGARAPASESTASTAVYPEDFPDPFVVRSHGFYWAFSTQVGLTKVPTLRSLDLVNWEWVGDALHELPRWATWGHGWAPAVLERGSGFVLYYTTRHRATGLQCISRAVSVLPQGPYLDESAGPLVCQTERGGSIDPSPFVDADGRAWLLWKSEGTLLGEPTRIWVQPLSPDGQQLAGAPTQLLERQLDWEFPIIEGPSMVLVDGRHHLFYSGNRWETADYAVGHAVCESVTGPCRRSSAEPVLATRPGEAGPGGQDLVTAPDGQLVMVHHAWDREAVGYPRGARRLHITSLRFDGDRVETGDPWGQRRPRSLVDIGPSR